MAWADCAGGAPKRAKHFETRTGDKSLVQHSNRTPETQKPVRFQGFLERAREDSNL